MGCLTAKCQLSQNVNLNINLKQPNVVKSKLL
jgi:hypothetical protein